MKRSIFIVGAVVLCAAPFAHAAQAATAATEPDFAQHAVTAFTEPDFAEQAVTEFTEPEFDFDFQVAPVAVEQGRSDGRRAIINVYPDMTFDLIAPKGSNAEFRSGDLDLVLSSRGWGRWSGFVEILLEGGDHEIVIDLERMHLGYEAYEWLEVEAGRMHNPLVRWNALFHRGAYLQTPIQRPAMARWEDEAGLWPVHFMGVMASGRSADALGLQYIAGVANGRGRSINEIQTGGDENPSKALVVGVGAAPEAVRGLTLFATVYRDRIPVPGPDADETDYTLSLHYRRFGTEVLAEWGEMIHARAGARRDFSTLGWYALVSQTLPEPVTTVRPYVMIDRLVPPRDEAYLEGAPPIKAGVLGLRWDPHAGIAVKAEYRLESVADADWSDTVQTQLSASF